MRGKHWAVSDHPTITYMTTVRDVLAEARMRLRNSESPALDAIVLLESVLQRDRAFILAEQRDPVESLLSTEEIERYHGYIARRATGEPIAYILGKKEFYGREFLVGPGVLVPRPDSECLVEEVVRLLPTIATAAGPWVVDCCTGTGCIGISVALEALEGDPTNARNLYVTLTDIDENALEWAKRNVVHHAAFLGRIAIDLVRGDLLSSVAERSAGRDRRPDVIVANPPYLTSQLSATPTVQGWQESRIALDGGEIGFDAIDRLVPQAFSLLASGGYLVVEHGADQGDGAAKLFRRNGFHEVATRRDLAGRDRFTEGHKPDAVR